MNQKSTVFIANASFFEVYSARHKPTFVPGRDFYSLTYRFKGRASIQCNGSTFESVADCVTFMPKNLSYTTEVQEDVHMAAIHFDLVQDCAPCVPTVLRVNDASMRSMFQTLIKKGDDETANFSRMSMLYTILAELQQLTHTANLELIPQKVVLARKLIEKNCSNALYSIDSLANELGVSTSYLRREFLAAYGSAPIQYLKALRIQNAKRLLALGDVTVAKIATICGYTSTSYFIQDFHKATGESPRRYQQRILLTY